MGDQDTCETSAGGKAIGDGMIIVDTEKAEVLGMLYQRAKENDDDVRRWNIRLNKAKNFANPHIEIPQCDPQYEITKEFLLELLEDQDFYAKALRAKKLNEERKESEHGLSGKFGVHSPTADV